MYFQAIQKLDALFLASICAVSLAVQAIGAPPKPDAHAEVGPHKGALIELGDEEYHAEVVNDEKTHTATVYLLDGAVKDSVPIAAKDITISLKHDGQPETFKLKAVPQKSDPAGLSSMFSLKDRELVHDLRRKSSDPRLMLKINGKPYSAKITLAPMPAPKD
jgi:hypothetical protein